MKKNVLLFFVSSVSLFVHAMETAKELDNALSGLDALVSRAKLPEKSIEPLAARGNLRAAFIFASNNLCSNDGDADKAYAFLEKGLALDDHPWRTSEQCKLMLDKMTESRTYRMLVAREESGDGRASYALGDIMFLKARLGRKAGIFYDSSVEPFLLKLGIDYYQRALVGDQLSTQQREQALRKYGAMHIASMSYDDSVPFKEARSLLEIENEFGSPGAKRRLAAFLVARGDEKDKRRGYQMLEAQIAANDPSVTTEDKTMLAQRYVCNHQEEKALKLLLPLADTELSPDVPEQEREAVRAVALFGSARLLSKEGKKEEAGDQLRQFIAVVDGQIREGRMIGRRIGETIFWAYRNYNDLNDVLSVADAFRANQPFEVDVESLRETAATGNLGAAITYASICLASDDKHEQDEAYAFLEKSFSLKAENANWRTSEQCKRILDRIERSQIYRELKEREESGDGRVAYALGDVEYLRTRLGHKAGICAEGSKTEQETLKRGMSFFERALASGQLSTQQRKQALRKYGAMRIASINYDDSVPFKEARSLLEIESEFGSPGAARRLAAFLVARGDEGDKKKGYQMLEARVAAGDPSVTSEDVVGLGEWYLSNNQKEKAFKLLLPLADTELSADAPEQEKETVGLAALLLGQELTHGMKAKKTKSKKKKKKKTSGIAPDYGRARHYITKALALRADVLAHFCLANLCLKEEKKEEAKQQFKQFIAAVDVDECKRENVLNAYSHAQVSMLGLELKDRPEMVSARISELFRVCHHSNKLGGLYAATNAVPNVFEQRTQQIIKARQTTPQELDLCYLFGRLCCDANKNEEQGLRCLLHAADNGHSYAQWFLGVTAMDKLIQRGSGPAASRVQRIERYLVDALCSGNIQDPQASQMLHTVVDQYAQEGGSLRILFAKALLAKREGKLKEHLSSLQLEVKQGNRFDRLDQGFVLDQLTPEMTAVLDRVKTIAREKVNVGACILAGRILVAEGTSDLNNPSGWNVTTLQEGVALLEKARKARSDDPAVVFYLGHALNRAGLACLGKKQTEEGYNYLIRAARECNNQKAKACIGLLLFFNKDEQLRKKLEPLARGGKSSVDDVALRWCQEAWKEKERDAVLALAVYWLRKGKDEQALRWLKEAKAAGVKEFCEGKAVDEEIALLERLCQQKRKKPTRATAKEKKNAEDMVKYQQAVELVRQKKYDAAHPILKQLADRRIANAMLMLVDMHLCQDYRKNESENILDYFKTLTFVQSELTPEMKQQFDRAQEAMGRKYPKMAKTLAKWKEGLHINQEEIKVIY